jgi:tellurite resistance protein
MDFLKTGPEIAPDALQAMTMVARAATNGLDQPQKATLDAFQRLILETDLDVDTLEAITAQALASQFGDQAQAHQLVRLMVTLCLVDGPPSLEQMALLDEFAEALGVDEPAINVIRHMAKGHLLRYRLAFARRSHVRTYFRNTYRMLGSRFQVFKAVLRFRKVIGPDQALADRFYAFEKLPEDTLGYKFFRHCKDQGIGFSGEQGGFPIGAMYHDFAHLLGSYDTSPEGEMKNAAFQAGFCQGDEDFFTMLFAISIHTTGVNLAPFPMPRELGRIGQGNLALETFHGWQRGAQMKVDLGEDWDFWDYAKMPIEVARQKLGVPPRDEQLVAL